jgi:TetR/AcrR family transcriptional repressor of bet genes
VTELARDTRTLRRQELRQAAYELAGERGFGGLTIAAIAEYVGLTKGNIHHYFKSKEDLLEQTVRFAQAEFREAVLVRLRNAKSPSERLWSVIDGSFAPELYELKYRRLWVSIFQEAKSLPRLARLLAILDRRTNMHIFMSVRQLVPPSQLDATAYGIMALMDGCWLLAVSEPEITREVALRLIADHICATIPAFDRTVLREIA